MNPYSKELIKWSEESCRRKLQNSDILFIKTVLRDVNLENLLQNQSCIDDLLDNEALVRAILEEPKQLTISLGLYFYILLRKALREEGVQSRSVTDYLVSLLKRKVPVERAFDSMINQGHTVYYLSDVLKKINASKPDEAFFLRVKLANQTLYLTGLFEDHFKYREVRRGSPNLTFYENVGQSQYGLLTNHHLSTEYGLAGVYKILGENFPEARRALSNLSLRLINLGDPFL